MMQFSSGSARPVAAERACSSRSFSTNLVDPLLAALLLTITAMPAGAQQHPAARTAPPAQPAATGSGLDSLPEDRVITELVTRDLQTLLKREFEVQKIPKEQQDQIQSLAALGELADPKAKLSPRERQDKTARAVAGVVASLPRLKDPKTLHRYALTLLDSTERGVNALEYWGENDRTKAQLQPVTDAVDKLLEKCSTEAKAASDEIANKLQGRDDPRLKQYTELEELSTKAEYERHMADYYRALSLDKADPKRKEICAKAIEYLKQFDNPDSQVMALVQNRMAKLHMAAGEFDKAKAVFKPVADNDKSVQPPPDVGQQYEAQYFMAQCDLLAKDAGKARNSFAALEKWQGQNLADLEKWQSEAPRYVPPEVTRKGVEAASAMLRYRIAALEADQSSDPAEKKKASDQAVAVLLDLVKKQPGLRSIIYEQLSDKLTNQADLKSMDPLLLQAVVQKGDQERLKPDTEKVDRPTIERAIAAAQELLRRKGQGGVDAETVESAALLIGVLEDRIDRDADAANAFIDYIEQFPGADQRNIKYAFEAAGSLVFTLRKSQVTRDDPTVVRAYERFLPMAVDKFGHKELAFEYARRLQQQGKYAQAVDYYRKVPADDKRSLYARFSEMIALNQELTDTSGQRVPDSARPRILNDIQRLASEVNGMADAALKSASTGDERKQYQSLQIRTTLLAADLARYEMKQPQRTLDLLAGFEQRAKGLPDEDALDTDALVLRVHSLMDLGKLTEATDTLLKLLASKGGEKGAEIVYGLLRKLDADLDVARSRNDTNEMRKLAVARAGLSGHLVKWAAENPDPKIRQYAYRYQVFDAATQQQAAALETDPAKKKQLLDRAMKVYTDLASPANFQKFLAANPGRAGLEYDPAVMLGIALVQFDRGDYKDARDKLGTLLRDRKLGEPLTPVERNDQTEYVDNDQYWEATYKLLRCNVELAKTGDKEGLDATKNYLKELYIRHGEKVGGAKWHPQFESLRKDLIPDFKPEDLSAPASQPVAKTP